MTEAFIHDSELPSELCFEPDCPDHETALARALHDELCDELCGHAEGDEGHVLHDLSRDQWEKIASYAREFILHLWRSDELPPWVLLSLRSHAFGKCLVCGTAADDPEAIHFCEAPR